MSLPEIGGVLGAVSAGGTDRPGTDSSPAEGASQRVVPAPGDPSDPRRVVADAIAEAVGRVEAVVKPEAAAAIARTFGFPLVLMLAVLLFLAVHWLMDRRDPKLRIAPRTVTETMVDYIDEDEL